MAEPSHYQNFVDHIVGDDDSELSKMRAERDYALHSLEREIAICVDTRRLLWLVVKANDGFDLEYEELQDYPGDDRARITQFLDTATNTLTLRASVHVGGVR